MTISMYQASVPVFVRMLTNLKGVLGKAAEHAQAKKIEESVLLGSRLYPDMFPLTRQIQIATDFARGTGARLAGAEAPSIADTELTFAELIDRIDRSVAYLRTLTAAQVDGSEAREISRPIRGVPHTFSGIDYLLLVAMPNFYFHTTTAYAILRHSGIEIGKTDFVGRFD